MPNKKKTEKLWNDWTLTTHEDCNLYSKGHEYALFDWDEDALLLFSVNETQVHLRNVSYALNFTIDTAKKEIVVHNVPEDL